MCRVCDSRDMNYAVFQIWMSPHPVMEPLVRSHYRVLPLDGQGQIEAVVGRVIEVHGQTSGAGGEFKHGDWYGNRNIFQQLRRIGEIGTGDVAATAHCTKCVGSLRKDNGRSNQIVATAEKGGGFY